MHAPILAWLYNCSAMGILFALLYAVGAVSNRSMDLSTGLVTACAVTAKVFINNFGWVTHEYDNICMPVTVPNRLLKLWALYSIFPADSVCKEEQKQHHSGARLQCNPVLWTPLKSEVQPHLADIHCNVDTACCPEHSLRILNNPWNQDTPSIRTHLVGPKGVRNRGVALYCFYFKDANMHVPSRL